MIKTLKKTSQIARTMKQTIRKATKIKKRLQAKYEKPSAEQITETTIVTEEIEIKSSEITFETQ
jgi:hypothetical protein